MESPSPRGEGFGMSGESSRQNSQPNHEAGGGIIMGQEIQYVERYKKIRVKSKILNIHTLKDSSYFLR